MRRGEKRGEQEEETILSENKAKTNLFIQIWEIAACFLQIQIDKNIGDE